jgi:integrase
MKKTRIADGIYQDAYGYEARVKKGSTRTVLREETERFPPNATVEEMQLWQAKARLRIAEQPITRGTLEEDCVTYFETATLSKEHRVRREQQLDWWCTTMKFGDRKRTSLTAPELRRGLKTLAAAGAAASTVNKYRQALSHVFTVLDGKNAPNPFRDVPQVTPPDPLPRGRNYLVIETILRFLTWKYRRSANGQASRLMREKRPVPSKGAVRLRVLAYAPVTPAQLKLVQPGDLDLDGPNPSVLVRGRKKAAGAPPAKKPLMPPAVTAFRDFIAADAFGTFTRGSVRKTFVRARDLAEAELRKTDPKIDLSDMVPYDLRHSFGTLFFQLTGSDAVTGELLDQRSPRTTRRYRLAAVPAHLQAASDAAAAVLAALPPVVLEAEAKTLPPTTTTHGSKPAAKQRKVLMISEGRKTG